MKQERKQENFESLGIKKSEKSYLTSKEDLTGAEKRRILETFVENDDALGLLLDFISNKHLNKQGPFPNQNLQGFQ